MADVKNLRRQKTLGAPPPIEEASQNLTAPEVAPPPPAQQAMSGPAGEAVQMRDGRSLRRTGRTLQFATRVSPEFDMRLRQLADRDGLLLVEVLERALDAYEKAT